MNDYGFLITIALALLGGAMSPGPSFLIVVQHSLSRSQKHGLFTAVGTALGAAVFALLAALGITAVLEQSRVTYFVFRVIGGAYLLYLAYKIWSGATTSLSKNDAHNAQTKSTVDCVIDGFLVQLSNPKTFFVIASIFSALMPPEPPLYTAISVGLIAFLVDFSWYAIVATSLSYQRSQQFYQAAKKYFDRLAACLLLLLSVKLFLEAPSCF